MKNKTFISTLIDCIVSEFCLLSTFVKPKEEERITRRVPNLKEGMKGACTITVNVENFNK